MDWNLIFSLLVYVIIFIIFTYEAGWIKWSFFSWTEDIAWNRRSKPWLIFFGAYLITVPILTLSGY